MTRLTPWLTTAVAIAAVIAAAWLIARPLNLTPEEIPMPVRTQRTRTPGGGMPPGSRYVGRGTKWGNPFIVGKDTEDRAGATALFREWLEHDSADVLDPYGSTEYREQMSARREWMLAHAADLAGRDLACWCKPPAEGEPDHCHAAVLLELAAAPAALSDADARSAR